MIQRRANGWPPCAGFRRSPSQRRTPCQGIFANQNVVCRLRDAATLAFLADKLWTRRPLTGEPRAGRPGGRGLQRVARHGQRRGAVGCRDAGGADQPVS